MIRFVLDTDTVSLLQRGDPTIAKRLAGYPPEELEKIVMAICSRELSAITWLGGVRGAAIGATQLFL